MHNVFAIILCDYNVCNVSSFSLTTVINFYNYKPMFGIK